MIGRGQAGGVHACRQFTRSWRPSAGNQGFISSFICSREAAICNIMSVTDSWDSVAPGLSHHQTTNFHSASQNDPSRRGRRCGSLLGHAWAQSPQGPQKAGSGLWFLPLTSSSHYKHIACLALGVLRSVPIVHS